MKSGDRQAGLTLKGPTSDPLGWDRFIVEENGFRLDCRDDCSRLWKLLPGETYLDGLARVQALLLSHGDSAYALTDEEVERLAAG